MKKSSLIYIVLSIFAVVLLFNFNITSKYEFHNNIISANLNLKKEYYITYNLTGGTVTGNPTSYNIETANITLKSPTRTGYTFAGWTGTDLSSATKAVTISKGSTGNRSYTANWTPINYTISYNLNGGSITGQKTSYNVETDSFTLPTPTRTGYTFLGWTGTDLSSATKAVTISKGSTGNRSYTANWTLTNYTISYNLNGGSASGNPTSYNITSDTKTIKDANRTGYAFLGWTGSNNLAGTSLSQYTKSNPYNAAKRDHILGNSFTVTPGKKYRVFVKGNKTKGTINHLKGGIWYTAQTSGNSWDSYQGEFTEISTGTFYKDITIPAGKTQGAFYIQLEQENTGGSTSWNLYDMYVIEIGKAPTIPKGSTGNKSYIANWKGTDAMVLSGSDFKNKLISIQKIANNNNDLNSNLMQTISWSNTKPDSKYLKDDYSITVNNDEYPTRIYLYPGETKKTLYFRDSESFGFKKTEIISKDEYDEKDTDNNGFTTYSNYRKLDIYVNYYMYSSSSNLYLNPNSNFSFDDCSGLTSLDLSKFNTSKVTDMRCMFNDCSGLTSLNLSNFNTSNVTNMSSMFNDCSGLTSLNLSNFNTSNVTDMSFMFDGCSGLTSLNLSNFNTSNVTDMRCMFGGCSGLTSLNLSNFNTSNVTNMTKMFNDCSGLTILDLSSFNTSKVTNMTEMFSTNSYSLTPQKIKTIYVSNLWSTSAVTSSDKMFYNCSNLKGGSGSGTIYNGNYIDKTYARIDGGTSKPGYFTYKASK